MTNKSPLKSWKKGQSGNPNGRPKSAFTVIRKELLDEMLECSKNRWKEIVNIIINESLKGNMNASRLIAEYCLPKVKTQEEDHTPKVSIEIVEVMKELQGKIPIEYIESMISALKNIEERKSTEVY